jgi:hypothetical protein
MQQKISALFELTLALSRAKAGRKIQIWKTKSKTIAKPATRQNDYKAGISVCIPIIKARVSQNAATKILGPISCMAKAILYFGSKICSGTILSALEIKNMLSTPIARIKNGTTSALIIVSFSFM